MGTEGCTYTANAITWKQITSDNGKLDAVSEAGRGECGRRRQRRHVMKFENRYLIFPLITLCAPSAPWSSLLTAHPVAAGASGMAL